MLLQVLNAIKYNLLYFILSYYYSIYCLFFLYLLKGRCHTNTITNSISNNIVFHIS